VRADYPILAQAAASVGGPALRHMATLGGNIATASPAGDSHPPLVLLEARIELASSRGRRELPLDEFLLGPRRTALAPGELIAHIRLPAAQRWDIQRFEKAASRRSLAIAIASLAAALRLGPDGTVAAARFCWGAVGPKVMRCGEAEAWMIGRRPDIPSLRACAELVRSCVRPIDDLRASADYRRRLAGNLLLRLATHPSAP
jgi:xanthine dehydrogenase FAD-binding subunit